MENLIIIAIPLIVIYFLYVGLVKKKNKVKEALSGVDVQLQKRSNLIPNILKIAKKFMEHEKELLTEITELRAQAQKDYKSDDTGAVKEHLAIADKLGSKMGQFMLNVENYPDLKSDQTMLQAQQSYNEVEEQIAAARRFYNSAVGELNNAVEIFPGNLIAPLAKAKIMPFYEADEAAKAPIDAGNFL